MRGHHADTKPLDHLRQGGQSVDVGDVFRPQGFKTPLDKLSRHSAGKRSYTITSRKRGRYIYARPVRERYDDIALDATVRQAAIHQSERERGEMAITIRGEDLQRKVRVRKASNLIVFVVDASWSMAAAERMKATKGTIMSLLVDAYQKRDRVCMISFQKDASTLVLPPTSSVEMAKEALRDIPVGGKTPLSAGLSMAYQVIKREENQNADLRTLMFLLTDGAGNVSMMGMPPREEALLVADLFAQKQIHSVVINTEHQSLDRGLAQELADALQAPCESLTNMRAENLYHTVRRVLHK
ncbi:MAG: vWA domain-containing protein [Anaerolineales bacterium]